jgi:hypothetical protein
MRLKAQTGKQEWRMKRKTKGLRGKTSAFFGSTYTKRDNKPRAGGLGK